MRESKRLCKTELIPEANCKHLSVLRSENRRPSVFGCPAPRLHTWPQYDKIVRGVEVVAQTGNWGASAINPAARHQIPRSQTDKSSRASIIARAQLVLEKKPAELTCESRRLEWKWKLPII